MLNWFLTNNSRINLGILKAGCPGELKKTCSNHAVLVEEPQWGGEKYKVFFEIVEKAF